MFCFAFSFRARALAEVGSIHMYIRAEKRIRLRIASICLKASQEYQRSDNQIAQVEDARHCSLAWR